MLFQAGQQASKSGHVGNRGLRSLGRTENTVKKYERKEKRNNRNTGLTESKFFENGKWARYSHGPLSFRTCSSLVCSLDGAAQLRIS